MNIIYFICIGLSLGIIGGFIGGGIRLIHKKVYSEERAKATKKIINSISFIIKYLTIFLLALGLIWCIYFLILGAAVPEQVDYANNMSELIVSVLTVISIIFAFVEFLKQTNDKNQ